MARTAIVNPRNKRRRRRNTDGTYAGASTRSANPRRRRRRTYGSSSRRRNTAPTPNRRRRRRNPSSSPASSAYSAGGYRRKNPDLFDMDALTDTLPAATLGVWAARFSGKFAGPFEVVEANKPAVPTFKHAIAIILGAKFGSQIVGNMLGSGKEQIAYAAALGFAGDLFARRRFFEDSAWVKSNLLLAGVDAEADEGEYDPSAEADYYTDPELSGFEESSELGQTPQAGQLIVGPDGQLYQLQGVAPDPADYPGGVAGFEQHSELGYAQPSSDSGFGYVR